MNRTTMMGCVMVSLLAVGCGGIDDEAADVETVGEVQQSLTVDYKMSGTYTPSTDLCYGRYTQVLPRYPYRANYSWQASTPTTQSCISFLGNSICRTFGRSSAARAVRVSSTTWNGTTRTMTLEVDC